MSDKKRDVPDESWGLTDTLPPIRDEWVSWLQKGIEAINEDGLVLVMGCLICRVNKAAKEFCTKCLPGVPMV